jgi:hypothetical protein
MTERLRQNYLSANPLRTSRALSFAKYRKAELGDETTRPPSERINHEINTIFKERARTNIPKLRVGGGINGTVLTAPGYFVLLQALHRTFKNCITLPIVLNALSGGKPNYGILPNPFAVRIFVGGDEKRFNLEIPSEAFLTRPLSSEEGTTTTEWALKQYKNYIDHPKYTVWQNLINSLNGDIQRFYFSLLNDMGTLRTIITNFINSFSIWVITAWTGQAKQEYTDETIGLKPFTPSPDIPLDIFQGIQKNKQPASDVVKIDKTTNQGPHFFKQALAEQFKTQKQTLLNRWMEGTSPFSVSRRPPSSSSSSSSSSSNASDLSLYVPLKEVKNIGSLSVPQLQLISRKYGLPEKDERGGNLTKKEMINNLITARKITNRDPVIQAKALLESGGGGGGGGEGAEEEELEKQG